MPSHAVTLARAAGLVAPALVVLMGVASASTKPERCAGTYAAADLERFLPGARLALSLPSTETVALEPGGRCIRITVRSEGTGRLVKLLLRGIAVPRAAIQLDVAPERRAAGS